MKLDSFLYFILSIGFFTLYHFPAHSQSGRVGIGTTTPLAPFHVDSTVVFTGTYNNTPALLSISGEGTRMLWYSDKGAFRAGSVLGSGANRWDADSIGFHSFAAGRSTIALGDRSIAMGFASHARGIASVALGHRNRANGDYTGAIGRNLTNQAYGSFVIGQYNVGGGNLGEWEPTDPVFEIGIGSDVENKNAMTVLKNGSIGIGPDTPDPTAVLDAASTTKGFLPPRMTEVQRDAITAPAEGLIMTCTDCDVLGLHQYINGSWQSMVQSQNNDPGNYGTVVNPVTGKVWLDRNLGATQVAISSTDADSYGDLYQWGRNADGHQIRTSDITTTLASEYFTTSGLFITNDSPPFNWLLTAEETHMWSGTAAENNHCPSGFRIPTAAEWNQERLTWSSDNAAGAFASPLKLPVAGNREGISGTLGDVSSYGNYWSSTVSGTNSRHLFFSIFNTSMGTTPRAYGYSVRCIKD